MAEQWFMRDLREHLGLTQDDVARVARLTQIRISILERGEDSPTDNERKALMRPFIARAAGRALEQIILSADK